MIFQILNNIFIFLFDLIDSFGFGELQVFFEFLSPYVSEFLTFLNQSVTLVSYIFGSYAFTLMLTVLSAELFFNVVTWILSFVSFIKRYIPAA